MVGIAQLVERQIVALDVVGSSPTILPFFPTQGCCGCGESLLRWGVAKW